MMEVEADLFLVFTGWDAKTTADMSLSELMQWHKIAIERHKKAQEKD
ncbi:GpE family phage tail protein [Vibrio parahaemolyticus]|nr:GpE family phage tail protein [Vibrio vulnificus]MBX5338917.1 GpE family phage tail protein [Vibrio parahaemolyticus]HAS3046055.1 GpE family phage tail protein [Vibrio parahaemolyticus]HAS3062120.1 GpE family phage tail protein [Vibrio parahaemolyticus]